jgi:hypothetical protein
MAASQGVKSGGSDKPGQESSAPSHVTWVLRKKIAKNAADASDAAIEEKENQG